MNRAFLENITDKKDLLKISDENLNKFLLENNLRQIEEIQNFLVSEKSVMLINGFLGTGKKSVINFVSKLLRHEVIVLRYSCFETTILDDILLLFFEEFKNLTACGVIKPPKVKVDNFTQKIDAYFAVIEKPVVIIIDSFESVLKNNKQDILDFIFHISLRENVKAIFSSRVFDYTDFEGKVPYDRTTMLALDKSLFEKLLRSEGVKLIGPVSDEFYKYSRGYFFYTMLSLKVINAHRLNLIDFIKGFTKSFLSYNDFILREAFAFVDPVSGHLFRFLTIMRHPVSVPLLKTLNLYDEEKINFFVDNLLLSRENNMIYLQDYYKDIAQNSIPESVAIKIHRACIDLYNTQLPLKPFERDLLISRQTMRTEIEYHSMFIPKRPMTAPMNNTTLKSIEYSAASIDKTQNLQPAVVQTPKQQIKDISFIFETEEDEKKIMSDIANSINKFIDYSNKTLSEEEKKLSLKEMLNSAKNEENQYNYKKALAFYQRALLMKDDDDFYTFLPLVYTKLAKNYSSLSDWFNALRYYDLALEFYSAAGDLEKIAMMKLEIANIFYITFKHDKAKMLLKDILESQVLNNELHIKACLAMANVCNEDLQVVYSYCKRALKLVGTDTDKSLLAELYFKSAVVCDDLNETGIAVKLYKKCTDIDKNNQFLAAAYSNLALIFEETNYPELAIKYYNKSYEIDLKNSNLNGMYMSVMRLADLNRKILPDTSADFYQKAVSYAFDLKEPFYQISSMIEYGDFLVVRKDFKSALKNYMKALELAKSNSSADNIRNIEKRIEDLKIRPEIDFIELESELLNEK